MAVYETDEDDLDRVNGYRVWVVFLSRWTQCSLQKHKLSDKKGKPHIQ